jgi:HK97 family phage portal protein
MAEDKSRFQKALDWLNAPTDARIRREQKGLLVNQSEYSYLNQAVMGYNTQSGYFDHKKLAELGDGTGNSAVIACLNVLATAFAEPSLIVSARNSEGDYERDMNHELAKLFRRPNPYMTQQLLANYIVTSLNANGDAFIYKNRNARGQVVELVPLMPHLVEAKGNENTLITHFNYQPHGGIQGEESVKIDKEDMIHLRQNVDPNNMRRGLAPLRGVLREIAGDEAAGQYTAALLHNMAVPGVILSPRDDQMGGPTREEAEAIADMYKQKFGGKNRGAPMVLSGAMNVEIVSFSPDQMKLAELRRIPEERVSAVLGVPAVLAGLGAGLDSATYSNTKELREFFTESKMVPMWTMVAQELTHQLLRPEFGGNDNQYCEFDIGNVRALADDKDNLYKRMNTAVQGGWVTIGEARKVVGLEADERHDVYLRPLNMIQVTEDGSPLLNDGTTEEPAPANNDDEESKITTVDLPPEVERTDEVLTTPTRLNEEKYIAEMPNGAYCVISHDDGEIIKCFETRKEAEEFLNNKKSGYIQEVKVSLEEAEVMYERGDNLYSPEEKAEVIPEVFETRKEAEERAKVLGCEGSHEYELNGQTYYMACATHEQFEEVMSKPENEGKAPEKLTNFPRSGDNQKISLSNSQHPQFPSYAYVKDLKENWPEIWRRAGTGGNPPTSFTGNDAFNKWTAYKGGDRSESTLNWVKRRERFMNRHKKNNRLNGIIAVMKWGGVTAGGVSQMKSVVNDYKKVIRERRKKSLDIAEEYLMKQVSDRVRKALQKKVEDHNSKNPKHRATLRMLIAVFNRGVGAYRNNPGSVRGNVTSADQWAMARVNGFLRALRTGKFRRKPYDQDLLPSSHPLSSKKSGNKAESVRVGQAVSWSINKDPDPPSVVHGIVTSVNDDEATMQVWARLDNGDHQKTDRKVTMPISKLRIISDFRQ